MEPTDERLEQAGGAGRGDAGPRGQPSPAGRAGEDRARARAAAVTPSAMLTDTEAVIDMDRLRRYRLGRLRQQLLINGFDAALLTRPISIRYASGVRNFALFAQHIPSAGLFVPVDGPVVLFDGPVSGEKALALGTVDEWRPVPPLNHLAAGPAIDRWLGDWFRQVAGLVRSATGGGARLALEPVSLNDREHFERHGVTVEDAAALVERARAIKSAQEIACMNVAMAVAEAGMWRMKEALAPGVTEVGLWSLLWQTNLAHGGDWIECRLLSSGDRTNPWYQEAGGRMIRPGDLVAFDTDMIGPFGYCADVSRTWLCPGSKPTPLQRDLYQRAFDEIAHNLELMKPGASFRELSERCFRQSAGFVANRYVYMAHGVGMCDEWPGIYYPQDFDQFGYDGELEAGMTICVESYVGAEGGNQGVKLEQQILVTGDGHVVLSRFPMEAELMT